MGFFRFVFLGVAVVMVLCGCSLLNIIQKKINEGEIEGEAFQVEKIIIGNQTYKAPQVLAKEAKERLEGKPNSQPRDSNLQTPDIELAKIKGIATVIFDKNEDTIYGLSGCGSYFSSYRWENRTAILVEYGTKTRQICDSREVMRFDFRFLRDFEGTFKVIQDDRGSLILQSKDLTIHLIEDASLKTDSQ